MGMFPEIGNIPSEKIKETPTDIPPKTCNLSLGGLHAFIAATHEARMFSDRV